MKSLIAGLVLGTGLLLAQPPQPPQPNYTNLKTYLGITDSQVTALQGVQTSERNAARSIMDTIASLQSQLDAALAASNPSASTVGGLMIQIQQQRAKLSTNHATFHTQAVGVLNSDQQKKLAALQAASDLAPTIHEADSLNLLTHTAPSGAGPGFGPRRMGGPGFGPAEMMGGPRPPHSRDR